MKDWTTIQTRYLQDDLPIRLGGIAANLSRVKSFASHDANREAVVSLIEESKFFIEWTAGEADLDVAAELIELQIQLSRWQHAWDKIWPDKTQRQQVASTSSRWSQRVLELSGLLD
ncbi:MAG: hypothetical protein JXA33_29510 [Anaerolineae bacterium]|nr:hypothetical protein [Anaerolineae bacterium]